MRKAFSSKVTMGCASLVQCGLVAELACPQMSCVARAVLAGASRFCVVPGFRCIMSAGDTVTVVLVPVR